MYTNEVGTNQFVKYNTFLFFFLSLEDTVAVFEAIDEETDEEDVEDSVVLAIHVDDAGLVMVVHTLDPPSWSDPMGIFS